MSVSRYGVYIYLSHMYEYVDTANGVMLFRRLFDCGLWADTERKDKKRKAKERNAEEYK